MGLSAHLRFSVDDYDYVNSKENTDKEINAYACDLMTTHFHENETLNLLNRAIVAYSRECAENRKLSWVSFHDSYVTNIAGEVYVILKSSEINSLYNSTTKGFLLRVYRVQMDGALEALISWPKEVEQD